MDAYIAHNAAVKQQQQWESGPGKYGQLCSLLYKHPHAKEGLTLAATSAADKRATEIAADACAKGVELQPWHSDELEQQLADRQQQQKAQEQKSNDLGDAAALKLINARPSRCDQLKGNSTSVRTLTATTNAYESALKQHPELVPSGTTPFDVANAYVTTCSTVGARGAERILGPR